MAASHFRMELILLFKVDWVWEREPWFCVRCETTSSKRSMVAYHVLCFGIEWDPSRGRPPRLGAVSMVHLAGDRSVAGGFTLQLVPARARPPAPDRRRPVVASTRIA